MTSTPKYSARSKTETNVCTYGTQQENQSQGRFRQYLAQLKPPVSCPWSHRRVYGTHGYYYVYGRPPWWDANTKQTRNMCAVAESSCFSFQETAPIRPYKSGLLTLSVVVFLPGRPVQLALAMNAHVSKLYNHYHGGGGVIHDREILYDL